MEADLVSHGGDSAAGSFVHTLTLTDVASGWTECVALVVRDGALVTAALEHLRTAMPFRCAELRPTMAASSWTRPWPPIARRMAFRARDRGRTTRTIRRGSSKRTAPSCGASSAYRRLERVGGRRRAIAALYAASRLFVNFFQPSSKLASKPRVGATVRKAYHAPETPYARLLDSVAVTDAMK